MKNTPNHNHTHHSSTARKGDGSPGRLLDIPPDLASKEQRKSSTTAAAPPPQRLNANFRLSTALCSAPTSSFLSHHQQAGSSSNRETGGQQQQRDWTNYSSCSFPLQQDYQQQDLSSLVGGIYDQEPPSIGLFATPSLPASMTAAAAVVAKFEPGSQMSTASSSVPSIASNGYSSAGNWSNHGMPADWSELAAAAAIGRSHTGLEPRMISTPPYYNPAANYAAAAASNAAYLYSPQHYYGGLQQRTVGNSSSSAPLHNYLAASNSAAAAAGCLNYGYTGSASTNLPDYYLNCYTPSGMLNPSTMHPDFHCTRTAGYCAAGDSSYKSNTNNSKSVSNTLANNITSDLSSTALMGASSNSSSLAGCAHQLSPTCSIKVEKSKRPKKRKLATSVGTTATGGLPTASPTEPNNTRVFVWELEDLCVLASHPYSRTIDTFMLQVIEQILRCAFLLENIDDCDQANIEDAEVEESMHESLPCNLLAAPLLSTNGLCTSTKSNASTTLSDCGASSQASGSSPTTTLGLQPTNLSNSSAVHNFSSIMMSANNSQITDAVMCGLANGNVNTQSTVNRGMLEGLRRIAAKYQHIRGTYERFKNNLSELLDFCGLSSQSVDIIERFQSYDKISGCQTERHKRCLKIIKERSDLIKDKCTNVVFTGESLATSLAKLMAFDLAQFVPAENVYSTAKNGKEAMLSRICERFKKQHVVIISSSSELGILAKKENIPFWKINALNDVDALYFALDTILLADTGISNQQSYMTQTKC